MIDFLSGLPETHRAIAITVIGGVITVIIVKSFSPTRRVLWALLQTTFATDLRIRIVGISALLLIDITTLLSRWNWDDPATISDVAEVSSLVMAFWYLAFRLDAFIEQGNKEAAKRRDQRAG
ncbi:hypothetical protein DFQ30_010687 [Apophysomyces sp. BC1015]|nr:hypothetical protein DFQ30_010687 [Apophysomyces sp. BC1015]